MMKIEKIIRPEKKKEGFTLILKDDAGEETEVAVSSEVFFKRPFKEGSEVDMEDLSELIFEDKKIKAREISLSMLDRGLKTRKEIEKKLTAEEIPEDAAWEVLSSLEGYGYIDDRHLSEVFIDSKISSRGKLKIKYDLMKKGVDRNVIEESFSDEISEKELEGLEDSARRKYISLRNRETDRRKIWEKLTRFLLSRGYEYDAVKKCTEKVMDEE